MHAHRLIMTFCLFGGALTFGNPAASADLPRSGTIRIHSNFKAANQAVEVGEKHLMGSGSLWGVTYNDAGSGPLQLGAWTCLYTFEVANGSRDGGVCAFGDAGGADKIFIEFTGKGVETGGDEGIGTITGGIGKYAGIQGKMAWQCRPVDAAHDLSACTQQFDYQLMEVAANK